MTYPRVSFLVALFLFIGLVKPYAQTITDIDGNTYKIVGIGKQIWMAENLRTTRYNDSSAIQNITDDAIWKSLTIDAYCDYDNNPANSMIYGKLYNWYVGASSNPKNVCPTGWHVPAFKEWQKLINLLGGLGVAGGKLKEKGTEHWENQYNGTTNETGFTALPGGSRGSGKFMDLGNSGLWWSATEDDNQTGWLIAIMAGPRDTMFFAAGKEGGFSIRCIKDK